MGLLGIVQNGRSLTIRLLGASRSHVRPLGVVGRGAESSPANNSRQKQRRCLTRQSCVFPRRTSAVNEGRIGDANSMEELWPPQSRSTASIDSPTLIVNSFLWFARRARHDRQSRLRHGDLRRCTCACRRRRHSFLHHPYRQHRHFEITTIEASARQRRAPKSEGWLDRRSSNAATAIGQIKSAARSSRASTPTDSDIDSAIGRNVCRCGT